MQNTITVIYKLFHKQKFYKQHLAENVKNKEKLSNSLRLNLGYLKIIRFLHSCFYHIVNDDWGENNRAYSKKYAKKKCVSHDEIIWLTHSVPMHPFSTPWKHQKTARFSSFYMWVSKSALGKNRLIIMSIEIIMKNVSHRKTQHERRHIYKYTKYKKCLGNMMLICIKQPLRNINWSLQS